MSQHVIQFSDEQRRLLINLEQHYDAWLEVERKLAALPYGMRWKPSNNQEYLYQIADRTGNGTSLGARSAATEQIHDTYHQIKKDLMERKASVSAQLAESCRLYQALRLPMIATEAARILREADRRSLLGSHLLVVGTNAIAAYMVEAGGRIVNAPDETQDFDMTWASDIASDGVPVVWAMLKAVDSTYTVNSERPFQARNNKAYEVEVLVAPSKLDTLAKKDQPRPVPLEEQEWLLPGRRVSHVVVARDGSPARIEAPDPRWFALQKMWMSEQDKRNPLKRPKDAKQGMALLNAIHTCMPHYPLDEAFAASLPEALLPHFLRWKANVAEEPPIQLNW